MEAVRLYVQGPSSYRGPASMLGDSANRAPSASTLSCPSQLPQVGDPASETLEPSNRYARESISLRRKCLLSKFFTAIFVRATLARPARWDPAATYFAVSRACLGKLTTSMPAPGRLKPWRWAHAQLPFGLATPSLVPLPMDAQFGFGARRDGNSCFNYTQPKETAWLGKS
jgi:hypothetical protein